MAAPTITVAEALVAIRVHTSVSEVAQPAVEATAAELFPASVALVDRWQGRSDVPADILNAAVVRAFGYLWDSDPSIPRRDSAVMVQSGAAALIGPFKVRRAGLIGNESGPVPPESASVPPQPGDGTYILQSVNGELTWVRFPSPS